MGVRAERSAGFRPPSVSQLCSADCDRSQLYITPHSEPAEASFCCMSWAACWGLSRSPRGGLAIRASSLYRHQRLQDLGAAAEGLEAVAGHLPRPAGLGGWRRFDHGCCSAQHNASTRLPAGGSAAGGWRQCCCPPAGSWRCRGCQPAPGDRRGGERCRDSAPRARPAAWDQAPPGRRERGQPEPKALPARMPTSYRAHHHSHAAAPPSRRRDPLTPWLCRPAAAVAPFWRIHHGGFARHLVAPLFACAHVQILFY